MTEEQAPIPTNTVAPSIGGSVVAGEVLSAGAGTWSGEPTSVEYQWQACNAEGEECVDLSEATSSTYALGSGDVGATVRVMVTANNVYGSGRAWSPPTRTVVQQAPTNVLSPTISGRTKEGETLQASTGTWLHEPTAYAYRWESCGHRGESCATIAGATGSDYELSAANVNRRLRVIVTASNSGGSTPADSADTAMVEAVETTLQAPVNTALPAVSGNAVEGETLSASAGSWSGEPTNFAYQWQDCNALGEGCLPIAGATSSSYKLAAADVGFTVRVLVTATNAGGSTPASSAATALVDAAQPPPPPPAPVNTALPVVSGSAVEGETLSASAGSWSNEPASYAYQWQDCNTSGETCANVSGATSSTYKLASTDVGHTVRVLVTATNAGGSTPAGSAATAVIEAAAPPPPPAAPVNTALPVISGTAEEGKTLTASTGSWSGSPTSYAYQWQDCNSAGSSCAAISGATGSSRVLASSDVGHTMRVKVTASNAGGSASGESTQTAVVVAVTESGGGVAPRLTAKECFENPETEGTARMEACGYPGTKNVGVEETSGKAECSALVKSGEKKITKSETIENTDFTGKVTVDAANVTLNHDCIVFDGGEKEGSGLSERALQVESASTGFTISNSTVRAENKTSDSFEIGINNESKSTAVASRDRIEDCGECVHERWTVKESYLLANGLWAKEERENDSVHREDWYLNDNTAVAVDDTILDPDDEVSMIFANTGNGSGAPCENHVTAEDDLVAGGGYTFQECAHATSDDGATMIVKNDRFARCLGKVDDERTGIGGEKCGTGALVPDSGADAHGYWPQGGYFGVLADESGSSFYASGLEWMGNFWDNNRHEVKDTGAEGSELSTGGSSEATPTNTALPSIGGTAEEGKTLTASTGSWSGSPTSYSYQWDDCNSAGEACSEVSGATVAAYTLAASDVGHTVRVVVTATNAAGSASVTSGATAVVVVDPPTSSGGGTVEPNLTAKECFENPETEGTTRIEACGYPGPKNVGAEVATGKKCSELESETGAVILNKAGERYEDRNLTGHITVTASDVTIDDDCITDKIATAEDAIYAETGASGLTVENSTIHGENHETGAIEIAINASGLGNVATRDYMYNCGECVHGEWTLTKSYIFVNGFTPIATVNVSTTNEQVHLEGYYLYAGETATVKEDTIFNPEDNALFFDDTFDSKKSEVCESHMTLEDNFFAGGGTEIYICAHAKSGSAGEGTSTAVIRDNRFARCLGTPLDFESGPGGTKCGGGEAKPIDGWPTLDPGADAHGYWPYGGYFGLLSAEYGGVHFKTEAGHVWEGNFWDNNLEACPEIEYVNCK